MGLAASFVLQQDLATVRDTVPLFAADSSGAYLAGATDLLRLTVERRGSNLRLAGALYNLATQRSTQTFEARSTMPDDLLTPLESVARQLAGPGQTVGFSTGNPAALQPFTAGAVTPNEQGRAEALSAALRLDPSFGLAHIALAETVGPSALEGVDPSRFTPLDRARWEALKLRLTNAPAARQMEAQRAILRLAPYNAEALATLGTLQFLNGDRAGGKRLLDQAISLNPANLALQVQRQRLLADAKAE